MKCILSEIFCYAVHACCIFSIWGKQQQDKIEQKNWEQIKRTLEIVGRNVNYVESRCRKLDRTVRNSGVWFILRFSQLWLKAYSSSKEKLVFHKGKQTIEIDILAHMDLIRNNKFNWTYEWFVYVLKFNEILRYTIWQEWYGIIK